MRNCKRRLGSCENLLHNGQVIDATEAAANVIRYMKECAERAVCKQITECVATCPANFRDDAKQALREAYERNGIKVLKLVPEPTAASFAYAFQNLHKHLNLLVYDFGGGTLDVSVVRVEGPQVTVLATEGIPELGGNDLNQPIRERLLHEIRDKFGDVPDREDDGLLYQELDSKSEAAKISLGRQPKVPVVIGYKGSQVIVEFTQDEYHQSIDRLVGQSLEAVDRAVQEASLQMAEIDHLVLVGGTSRMPYVQERVAQHTGLTPKTDIDPDKAIAYGAALVCITEMANEGRTATIRNQVIPPPDMFVQDVTAHTVGCAVLDSSEPSKQLLNSELIAKNTPIPCHKTDHFFLEHEDQCAAKVEILQGDADAPRDECLSIGELLLEDLPREPIRTKRLRIDCTIDVNGMVTVTATDKVSDKTQTVSVDYKKGIRPKDKPAPV